MKPDVPSNPEDKDLEEAGYVALVDLERLPERGGLEVAHEGRVLALFRVGDRVHAMDGLCGHRGGPLAEGLVDEQGSVICPWHGLRFDLETGASMMGGALAQEVFPALVLDGRVWVRLGSSASNESH